MLTNIHKIIQTMIQTRFVSSSLVDLLNVSEIPRKKKRATNILGEILYIRTYLSYQVS
jgi:hypothetical protein